MELLEAVHAAAGSRPQWRGSGGSGYSAGQRPSESQMGGHPQGRHAGQLALAGPPAASAHTSSACWGRACPSIADRMVSADQGGRREPLSAAAPPAVGGLHATARGGGTYGAETVACCCRHTGDASLLLVGCCKHINCLLWSAPHALNSPRQDWLQWQDCLHPPMHSTAGVSPVIVTASAIPSTSSTHVTT
jgi:hypothetical protein